MNGSFNLLRRRGYRDWLGALALLGLLARALIPVGFMPQQVQGQIQLVLCSSQGADSIHTQHAPRSSASVPCLFAAGGAALAPAPCQGAPSASWLPVTNDGQHYCAPANAAPLRHAAARGPPANV